MKWNFILIFVTQQDTLQTRFDTKIILGFSDLFSLHDSQIFVQFYEVSTGRDLISREGPVREYQVDNIKIVEK